MTTTASDRLSKAPSPRLPGQADNGVPRPVSILSDLNAGNAGLAAPPARFGRWPWMGAGALMTALIAAGVVALRGLPVPTGVAPTAQARPAAQPPVAAPIRPVSRVPAEAAPSSGETSAPSAPVVAASDPPPATSSMGQAGPRVPSAARRPADRPHPAAVAGPAPREAPSRHTPRRDKVAPQGRDVAPTVASRAAPKPAPGPARTVERDVDIVTAIVR